MAASPKVLSVSFNDAYRRMDWLLTVRLLAIEILLTVARSSS